MCRWIWLIALCSLTSLAAAADWPQWRGPDRDGISKETGLLPQWPAEGPPLAWKIKGIGEGMGGVAVRAGRIFTTGDEGDASWLFALNEADGTLIWKARIGRSGKPGFVFQPGGPRATPTIEEDRVYILSQYGDFVCFDQSGREVWRVDFVKDLGGAMPTWGFSESPLVDGEKIICTPGGKEAAIAALDKKTGKLLWKCAVPPEAQGSRGFRGPTRGPGLESDANYSSVIAVDFDGQRQYVQVTARALVGVTTDGQVLWHYTPVAAHITCATPIHHDGMIFASSAYEGGGGLVKLTKDESARTKIQEVYFTRRMRNHHGGFILHDGCVYGAHGGNEGGYLVCLDFLKGEILWDHRPAGKGSVTFADGRLYYRTEAGTVLLIEPTREGYRERGRLKQPDRSNEQAWPHPVIANGKLYLRDQNVLLAYDIRAK